MIVSAGSTKERFLIPEGLHPARCVTIAGIGEQEKTFQGETKMKREVIFAWEFPTQMNVFNPDNGEQPAMLSNIYTASLDERSNLFGHLTSWRGAKFTPAEIAGFDLKELLGKECQILVKHNTAADGRVFANIGDILKVDPANVGAQITDSLYYDAGSHDQDAYDKLPEWIQGKVNSPDAPKTNIPF